VTAASVALVRAITLSKYSSLPAFPTLSLDVVNAAPGGSLQEAVVGRFPPDLVRRENVD